MRRIFATCALAALALAACRDTDSAGSTPLQPDVAITPPTPTVRYIVVYNASVPDTRAEIARHVSFQGARVDRVYQHSLRGWSGDLSPAELTRLRGDAHVAFIERDQRVHIATTQAPTPSWGLDRIDQSSATLNGAYSFSVTGTGVHFYGIDTGILYSHNDFGGRASVGLDAVSPSTNGVDCNGHGTHTASTAAGTTYGVAKGMTIVGVRVLDCTGSGWISDVLAGVDWVTQHAIRPAVANMSLGGGLSTALDRAVAASIASGVVYTISAGNSNWDACQVSPADVPAAITVSASDSRDFRASFSNFGTCTDLFAPGVNITAAWRTSNTATSTLSGTSMAAPHAAGVAGLYLEANPTATPAQVASALVTNATSGRITNPGTGSPNRLLYMGFIGGTGNRAPSATMSQPAAGASFPQGTAVAFLGSAIDPEQGVLTGAALVWTSSRDGRIGTGTGFSKANLTVGTHTVTLTATDAQNATATAARTITITPSAGGNQRPVAAFTVSCNTGSPHQCSLNAGASTDDVGIVSYAWNWGDGRSETKSVPVVRNTWARSGVFTVTLTVTDGGGLTAAATKSVTVP